MEKLQKTKDERKKNTSIFLMNTTTMIKPNLKGDYLNICILIFLYSIQSLTFGLYFAIQILIQSRNNASYQDQVFDVTHVVTRNFTHSQFVFLHLFKVKYFK